MIQNFSLGHSALCALRITATAHGAGETELASIDRLELYRAEQIDIERLIPLAQLAELPWSKMFPELSKPSVPEVRSK